MLVGNISSKNNLTQQDPSNLSTSQNLKTYYFRDETVHRDQMSQAFGKLEFLHKHFQLSLHSHLRWLYLESAELFCRFISSCHFQIYDSSVLLLSRASCFRASFAPPHTCSFTMAILAEPFHPSCLLIHHFRSPLRATGLLPLSDFPPHTWLFTCPGTFPADPAVGSLPTFPLATSDTLQTTFVPQQWEFVPSSVHSKEKLLLQLHQLTGREQGKFVKLTRLTLNTSLQKYFSRQMFWKFVCFA